MDSTVTDFMADYPSVKGVTLAIVRGGEGQIYEEGYPDFDRNRISLIASTGKVLSAGVILALVDDGLLELDRPIAEYLDWGDYHLTVTMRQILSMMSGLPPSFWIADACYSFPCECDPATNIQECGRTVFQDESMSIPPGEEFRYTRWQLAGAVAETVSNMSWAELVRQKLVAPCGLPNTGYRKLFPEYPEAFDGDPANVPESENPGLGGGAYSTVNDYSKVLLMHLRDGLCGQERVLSPEMLQAMQEDLVPEGVA
ncbi:MAG: beta-lactamase family protein, partial [Deltaproteobacteria bacterium]|nr:beta-lactamase family protein [Deltaproteobacteria bacterium]